MPGECSWLLPAANVAISTDSLHQCSVACSPECPFEMARRAFCFIIVASEVKAVFDMDQHKLP
jgi:hypothetical protein